MLRCLPSAVALFLLACGAPSNRDEPGERPEGQLLSVYYPSPEYVVTRMLELADLQPDEVLYDLGSGDGRIVIIAARDFGARTLGFEIDPDLIELSRGRIAALGLDGRARIEARDLLEADFSEPDVMTTFLPPEAYTHLEPRLRKEMKPGSRLVAYKFAVPGWEPDETVVFEDEDPEIPAHEIFLYRTLPTIQGPHER
jgi:SAM-dependent methyltransferase